ncbi:hypothetical protein LXL04_009134 [Taraxacum kok-saghyz]
MCTAHEGNFVNPPTQGPKLQEKSNLKTLHLCSLRYDSGILFLPLKPAKRTETLPFDDAKTLPPVTLPPTTLPPAKTLAATGDYSGDMSGADGFFDDINAMFFLVDEMPPAIGEYMSMMLFESDEDQPPEDESDEDQPTEKEGDEGDDLEEDDLVDEENNVPEIEVDMADFTLNLDGDESEIHIDGGAANEEVDEDLDVIDNERWDSLDEGSDDDMRRRNVLKNLGKEKRCNLGNVHKPSFYVRQKFKSKKELKDLIDAHAIQSRRNLYFEKNDKLRLREKCRGVVVGSLSSGVVGTTKSKDKCVNSKKEGCKWALHASRSNEESDWFVKTLKDNHSCLRSRKLRACTATFLSKEMLSQIETDPRVPLRSLVEQIESKSSKAEDERMSRSQRGGSSQATNQDEGIRVGKDGAKKLTRKYGKVTCSKCKNTGHNARSCTGR